MKLPNLLIVILFSCLTAFSQGNICPKINLAVPELIYPGRPFTFTVKVEGDRQDAKYEYFWMRSLGKIIKGQGEATLEFEAGEEDRSTTLGVAVKVSGLPDNCPDTVSKLVVVAPLPEGEPVDEFGKTSSTELAARMDGLIASLNQNSTSMGLLEIIFNKKDSRNYKISFLKKLSKIFAKYNISTRITLAIIQSDYERNLVWIVPPGADYPKSRVGDYKKITENTHQIIKAGEIKQKLNTLRL